MVNLIIELFENIEQLSFTYKRQFNPQENIVAIITSFNTIPGQQKMLMPLQVVLSIGNDDEKQKREVREFRAKILADKEKAAKARKEKKKTEKKQKEKDQKK